MTNSPVSQHTRETRTSRHRHVVWLLVATTQLAAHTAHSQELTNEFGVIDITAVNYIVSAFLPTPENPNLYDMLLIEGNAIAVDAEGICNVAADWQRDADCRCDNPWHRLVGSLCYRSADL